MGWFERLGEKKAEAAPCDPVVQAAADLAGMEDMCAANRYMDEWMEKNSSVEKIANNIYRCGDVMINVGKCFAMQAHARSLEIVKNWELETAPKLIAFSVLKNGTDCVLLTQIDGVGQSMPVPCQGSGWRAVSEQGKNALLADVQKLCARALINEALLDTRQWHVIESNGRIVISNWALLRRLPSESEGRRILECIEREFSDRGI